MQTHTHRVRPFYNEEAEEPQKPAEEEKNTPGEEDEAEPKEPKDDEVMSDAEIDELVTRSGEVTWDEFFAIFEGHVS